MSGKVKHREQEDQDAPKQSHESDISSMILLQS